MASFGISDAFAELSTGLNPDDSVPIFMNYGTIPPNSSFTILLGAAPHGMMLINESTGDYAREGSTLFYASLDKPIYINSVEINLGLTSLNYSCNVENGNKIDFPYTPSTKAPITCNFDLVSDHDEFVNQVVNDVVPTPLVIRIISPISGEYKYGVGDIGNAFVVEGTIDVTSQIKGTHITTNISEEFFTVDITSFPSGLELTSQICVDINGNILNMLNNYFYESTILNVCTITFNEVDNLPTFEIDIISPIDGKFVYAVYGINTSLLTYNTIHFDDVVRSEKFEIHHSAFGDIHLKEFPSGLAMKSEICKKNDETVNHHKRIDIIKGDEIKCVFTFIDPSSLTPELQKKKKSGGSCADCVPPTFGKSKQYKQLVHNGFSFNGIATDVTNYHTEYPLITVETNQTNNLTLTAYENNGPNNIKWFQVGFGMPEIGAPLSEAQTLVTISLKGGEVEKIEKVEKYPLIDVTNVTTSIVECGYTTSDCLAVSMDYIYRDQPKYNVMAINAMDISRNSIVNFMNDGILVVGKSLNEPLLDTITAEKGGAFYPQRAGIVELTLIDYKTDMWQDEYGYLWTGDNYKSFKIIDTIPVPIREPDKAGSVMTRQNSIFSSLIIAEQDKAILHFDASKLVSILDETFAYDLSKSEEQRQAELDIRIADEIKRLTPMTRDYSVNQHSYQVDSYDLQNQYDGKSVSEIAQANLSEKLKLQEELLQKRLDQKKNYSN